MRFHPLFDFEPAERARIRTLPLAARPARAAASRDALLTHRQLRALGFSDSAISRKLGSSLFEESKGIYAVGRPGLSRRGRLRAALLRYGRTAALSHRTAATQHDVLTRSARIDVTVTTRPDRPPRRSGIDLHYTRRWLPDEVEWVQGLPCTSIARTVADLAGAPRRKDFVRAWNGADQRLLLDMAAVGRQVHRRRRGSRLLQARLERCEAAPATESEAEDVFVDLCEAEDLPRPVSQRLLGDGRIDFVFVDHGVAVEIDSRAWHTSQDAFQRDREKDLAARAASLDPHRYTYWQLVNKGPQVAAVLRIALAEGAVRIAARSAGSNPNAATRTARG